ncbi:hypothetical protein BGZ65_005536 [Modicella reniformis]|uniref:Zn(2)-C6 fungal-type domain-containing protein n=1 Tax=Modicella reniformis TaxID=1440133 RepID=A0A9P6MGI0_9FUNG|nr:hypothetical protein BGZ65_005536 [Modicella reniformis]
MKASFRSATILATPESQRTAPPPKLNQNQVHAQTHPWRIKVYNACLACRKKKIKCDGQPTCQRCTRLGFVCSYIEVPPQAKNSKQKATDSAMVVPTSSSSKAIDNGSGHTTRDQLLTDPQSQSNAVEATKEIRQQRRSSTKDAARTFPHPSTKHSREPPPAKDLFGDRSAAARASTAQTPRTELGSGGAPGQVGPRPMTAYVMDRDVLMPDLYHILVNSVTIPNVSKQTASSTASPGGVMMSMDQLCLTLASPAIPTFTVPNSDHADLEQHHSSFQKYPSTNSFLDQSTPLGFVITNKSVIQYLVHVYFECFHPHWMIVDKEKFLAQLKDRFSPPDPLLLVAICAAGAKYSDHEKLCTEIGNLATVGDQFLTHARILLQDRFDMPSMSTLQALLILYWCQVQTGRASLRFMYVGMAIRMAQEMGLNRPLDSKRLKDMDEREVQIRKIIWWSCYQADRWTSAALGKPMVISDVDCLVEYPSSLNEGDRYYVQSFRHMTDLAKILGKVILNLYTSTNAATCSSAVFSHLDQSLKAWVEAKPSTSVVVDTENVLPTPTSLDSTGTPNTVKSSGPLHAKSTTESKSGTPVLGHQEVLLDENLSKPEPSSEGHYALLYHTVRIMLYRPFLHNSALAPVLPLTLQSPQTRDIEIAEHMVTEQRSYRQLLNSIHVSLCAAGTVHRFVIVSQHQQQSEGSNPTEVSLSSTMPATLSNAPSHAKTDLYYLALLLRILYNCCRFSIEKNLLCDVIDAFLPHKHLSPQETTWAREEIHRPFTIVPFSIKIPLQMTTGLRTMMMPNMSSVQQPVQQLFLQHQPQPVILPPQPGLQQQRLQEPQSQQTHQQYQLSLRQHQQEQQQQQQQQGKQQTQARHLHSSTGDITSISTSHSPSLGPSTSDSSLANDTRQVRSNGRTSSMSGLSEYVGTVAVGALTGSGASEQQQQQQELQQYQRELDILQYQHRMQQSELSQQHQQQTLQLEQAQFQQRSQEYLRQSQQQQGLFSQQQQPGSLPHSPTQSPPASIEVMSPKTSYASLPDHATTRNKRQGEASFKKKQAKQRHHDPQDEVEEHQQQEYRQRQELQRQQEHQGHFDHQRRQARQQQYQQSILGYTQADSPMTDASPPDMEPNLALGSVPGMAGSDEMMASNSAPSGKEAHRMTSAVSLDELLGIEPTGYYSEMPATNTGDNDTNMDSAVLPLAGSSSVEGQSQGHLTGSSNNSDQLWQSQQQQPSATVTVAAVVVKGGIKEGQW